MQGRPQAEAIQLGIDGYEQMMNTFANKRRPFGSRWDQRASRWLNQ
jgi:hypothetical protein